MANPGNTGKRYKYRHIAIATVSRRGGIRFTLDCGHALAAYEPSDPPRPEDHVWTEDEARVTIGTRVACMACGAQGRA